MSKASELLKRVNEETEGNVELDTLPSGKQIPSELWTDRLVYKGVNVFSAAYEQGNSLLSLAEAEILSNEKSFDGQECFLAFSPSTKLWYMAFEGSYELAPYEFINDDGEKEMTDDEWENISFVVSAKLDGDTWHDVRISDSYSNMFYGAGGSTQYTPFKSIQNQYKDLILIRLD